MIRTFFLACCLAAVPLVTFAQAGPAKSSAPSADEVARWQREAKDVTIVRDDWGIAHVHGKNDAEAVFGMEYAQAEDDFNRVETNYLDALGMLAQAEGESEIYRDLREKLFVDPAVLKRDYAQSPPWLKKLMDAFADGLNFYLYKHPEVKPRVITHFEPWMALSFTEGSIGGDIERVNLRELQDFYGSPATQAKTGAITRRPSQLEGGAAVESLQAPMQVEDVEPRGSNGVAIAPRNTTDHHALLLINPHTTFFFRSELQMSSDEGLDAYGAVTWGQFFVYQGFNPHVGWMHTSSGVDAVDEYLETVSQKNGRYFYKYGKEERPMTVRKITVPYKSGDGMAQKTFTVYYTVHGPVERKVGDRWVTMQLMEKPIEQLEQSYLRTKAHDYASYLKTMDFYANSSNNTIFADTNGDIAYFQSNFIPRRDNRFDYTKPVDGSDPATNWHGHLSVQETPHLLNPPSGWLYNSNDAPWNAAGPGSLKKSAYPAYVEMGGESARGLHALRVFDGKKGFSVEGLRAAAYDSYLPWFERTLPALFKAWDATAAASPFKAKLAEQIAELRGWDMRWGVDSAPTSLAVFWGTELMRQFGREAAAAKVPPYDYIAQHASAEQLLQALAEASDKLAADFGSWKTPWGEINRYQRLDDEITPHFDDSKPSTPVGFTSSIWGSLASFGARQYSNTKKWYGTSGNSFVAVIEFGPRIHAVAVTAGGESGHPDSPHFNDEAERYCTGNLREVYFYPEQLKGHTEKQYHPGE